MPSSLETRMRNCFLRRGIRKSFLPPCGGGCPKDRRGVRHRYPPSGASRHLPPQGGKAKLMFSSRADPVEAAHIGTQRLGNEHRTVRLLIIFQNRHERASDGEPRAVQRMDEAGVLFALCTVARIHAAGLEVAAIRAG